jgi:hypothetical protein
MKIVIFIFLFIIPTNSFATNFKMSCSGKWSPYEGDERFNEKFIVTDTNVIKYEFTYYPPSNKVTRKTNVVYKIIKKEKDEIYAIPVEWEYNVDFFVVNLEKSKIFFYKTEYSSPDLKNRVKETTKITKTSDCVRIN